MTAFRRFADGLGLRLKLVAEAAIVAMMVLTCADVLLRLFGLPVKGVYDLVSIAASAAVAFALAYTGTQGAHVSVTFVTDLLPRGVRSAVFRLTRILGAGFFGLVAWESAFYGTELIQTKEVSATLRMPFYPFVFGVALGAAALALVLLADVLVPSRQEAEQEIP